MNEQNKEVLTKIYQNAKMGSDSISYVNEKSDDESLKSAADFNMSFLLREFMTIFSAVVCRSDLLRRMMRKLPQ